MAVPTILESVGVEYEFPSSQIDNVRRRVPPNWSVERDGSVTTDRTFLGHTQVDTDSSSLRNHMQYIRLGGEAISPILSFENSDEIISDIERLMSGMNSAKEKLSDLASVHVHVCAGKYPSAKVLKNIIRLACAVEAPMFRLSVAEHPRHRGVDHEDYMYCRPITGNGPQIVRDHESGWFYAFDLKKILENAKTNMDVIRAWCRADYQPSKWVPSRYYWVHMSSIYTRGTLEIRSFNQTLHSKYIRAWVDLTRAFLKTAWSYEIPEILFPLGNSSPEGWNRKFSLGDFFDIIRPEIFRFPDTEETLAELWFKADWQPGCSPQINHLCIERRGRSHVTSVPLYELGPDLIPERASRELVERLLNDSQDRPMLNDALPPRNLVPSPMQRSRSLPIRTLDPAGPIEEEDRDHPDQDEDDDLEDIEEDYDQDEEPPRDNEEGTSPDSGLLESVPVRQPLQWFPPTGEDSSNSIFITNATNVNSRGRW